MLGFDMKVHRGGSIARPDGLYNFFEVVGSERLMYVAGSYDLIKFVGVVRAMAVEVVCEGGYPSLYKVRAGDFPYKFGLPPEEILVIEMWDQS